MTDPLARLARLNRTSVFLAALVVVLLAFFAPAPIGGVLLLVIAAGLAALLVRTWPVQQPGPRTLRLIILGLLVVVALTKLF